MTGEASIACATLWDVLREPALNNLLKAKDAGTLPLDIEEKLQQLILDASADLERSCGRRFKRQEWTEVLDVTRACPATFRLLAAPVHTITSVTYADDGDFQNGLVLAATDCRLRREGRLGELAVLDSTVLPGIGVLQVIYDGGLATRVERLPADLRQAVAEQVAFAWKRNLQIDVQSVSQDHGAVTYYREGDGTVGFYRARNRYRAAVIG